MPDKRGYSLYYYKKDDNGEIEFLIEKNGEVIPVEVKVSNSSTASLNRFIEKYKPSVAYKLVSTRGGRVETKLTISHYMLMFILTENTLINCHHQGYRWWLYQDNRRNLWNQLINYYRI